MQIAIIGTGYVGLVTGACFAHMGNTVWCVDIDGAKIENLKKGVVPVYESGLADIVGSNLRDGRLLFTTDIAEALERCAVCFIAAPTPRAEDGGADLSHVFAVADGIGRRMTHSLCVVNKSTVPVGTARLVARRIRERLHERGLNLPFTVLSNPEFLKEGSAVYDCLHPDRVIVGADSEESAAPLRELYKPFVNRNAQFLTMDTESAELTKYAANAMLAAKISFMNEIANICERTGADVNKVRIGIGGDRRIGHSFIYPGCGYGGSCFPKDVDALIRTAEQSGCEPRLLAAVRDVNERQKSVMAAKVKAYFGEDLSGVRIGVWGLAFKPDTDDMRGAASVTVINELTRAGAKVVAYDPKAMETAEREYFADNPNVGYASDKFGAVADADALVLITEWKEFRSPDYAEMRRAMKRPVVFDGRNQYDPAVMRQFGFFYAQIGVADAGAAGEQ
jgi:UDPglucose 6-dehydrogenase